MDALLSARICMAAPSGPAVRPCEIFIRETAVTPQPDGTVPSRGALTLSLVTSLSVELPGEACSQAVLLQSALCTTSLPSSLPDPFQVTQSSAVPGHCLFFWVSSVDTYYSSAT